MISLLSDELKPITKIITNRYKKSTTRSKMGWTVHLKIKRGVESNATNKLGR